MYTSLSSCNHNSSSSSVSLDKSKSESNSPQKPIYVEECEEKPIVYWARDLGLHKEDKDIICNGDWITDKHVSAMNTLLTAQFPTQQGLQDSLLLAWHCREPAILCK